MFGGEGALGVLRPGYGAEAGFTNVINILEEENTMYLFKIEVIYVY
jgi:hypothetical protein